MVKLELLSKNLVLVMKKIFENDNLCKYIYYDTADPLSEPPIPNGNQYGLTFGDEARVKPYRFDPQATTRGNTNLRIWYPEGQVNKTAVEKVDLFFDIVVAKGLWLISTVDESQIRPFMIAQEIVNTFNDNSVGTLGKIDFEFFSQEYVNQEYEMIRLIANIKMFTTGKS